MTIPKTLIASAAITLLVAGCSGSTSTSGSSSSSPTSPGAPQFSDQQAPPNQLVIEVTITKDAVTPTNQQLKAKVNEPIVVRIDSDGVADELHVHSTPDHTFKVEGKPNQSFQFTPTVPGKVDIELHQLNRTIATVEVQ